MRGVTRREFLAILAAGTGGTGVSWAQEPGGMASRGVRPQPRGKPSGLPFHARFTDVAAHARLRAPIIYGPPDRMDYILESMGCGVAFLDYDNDGWLDIFLLSGTRREELILSPEELDGIIMLRRSLVSLNPIEAMEQLVKTLGRFPTNKEFLAKIRSIL